MVRAVRLHTTWMAIKQVTENWHIFLEFGLFFYFSLSSSCQTPHIYYLYIFFCSKIALIWFYYIVFSHFIIDIFILFIKRVEYFIYEKCENEKKERKIKQIWIRSSNCNYLREKYGKIYTLWHLVCGAEFWCFVKSLFGISIELENDFESRSRWIFSKCIMHLSWALWYKILIQQSLIGFS